MIKRREFMQVLSGLPLLPGLSGTSESAATAKRCDGVCGRTDIHAHYLPAPYAQAIKRAGLTHFDGGIPIPEWSVDKHLAMMTTHGIATAMLSISSPGLDIVDGSAMPALARQINEAGAQICLDHPGRFGAFAALPLPNVAAALDEIDYAFDHLNLDGVALETNVQGIYPAAPGFFPILEALDRRGAVVYMHPSAPRCFDQIGLGLPAPLIEFPFDTTRAVVDLIFTGTLRRLPNLKLVLSHGGGALPILLTRIAAVADAPFVHPRPERGGAEVLEQVRRLYFDLALAATPLNLQALLQITSIAHILFGSDFPFAPPPAIAANTARYDEMMSALSVDQRRMIDYDNAHDLFPRLRQFLSPG